AAVLHSRFCRGESASIDRKRRHSTTEKPYRFGVADDRTETESRKPRSFGKRARYKKLRIFTDPRHDGNARELRIGFLDHHNNARRSLKDLCDLRSRKQGAGGVVGISDKED